MRGAGRWENDSADGRNPFIYNGPIPLNLKTTFPLSNTPWPFGDLLVACDDPFV
jgi:hypothetical protein